MFVFTAIFGWFSFVSNLIPSPLKSLVNWVIIIGLIVGGAFLYLKYEENKAYQTALSDFNAKQVALQQAENKKFQDQINSLNQQTADLTKQNDQLNDSLQDMEDNTVKVIDNTKDTTLDPLFNTMLNSMKGQK